MRLLAIDPSSSCTGWAVFEDNKLVISGIIKKKTSNKYVNYEVCHQASMFNKLLDEYEPDAVIMESTAPYIRASRSASSLIKPNQVIGAMLYSAFAREINCDLVYPETWKVFYKAKTKEDIVDKVRELFNIDVLTNDESDAIAIGWWWLNAEH